MAHNEAPESIYKQMIELVQRFLPLDAWGFQQTEHSITSYPTVVYDCASCRLQFVWGGWDMYAGNTISIYYGRLHAPSDKAVITWNGEECYCWHQVNDALHFLDGLSPQEAVDRLRIHSQWPSVMEQFRQSELGKSLERTQPEWIVRMHSAVWEEYGTRLFELFDLRHPELWQEFRQFLKEFYELKGISPLFKPPQHQCC